jgi:hypothetical protein
MIGLVGYYKVLRGKYLERKEEIEKVDRKPRLTL